MGRRKHGKKQRNNRSGNKQWNPPSQQPKNNIAENGSHLKANGTAKTSKDDPTETSPCQPSQVVNVCKTELPKENYKNWIKKNHCKNFAMVEGLYTGKLEMTVEHKDEKNRVQKLSFGKENHHPTKVILLVGATGTGKTTLINAMTNYICGVNFDDDFRFRIVDDKDDPNRSEALSQTDYITAFSFYHFTGMPFDFNYVLIDTPGFGDTRGIERDQEMMTQIESFLKQDYGIDQVDGVGFVVPASATRLTQTQRYVLDGLSSIFGKDIKQHIFVMATFADARTPPVLKALAEAKMEYGEVYKFNNSALYARSKIEKYACGNDSDSDAEDEVSMSRQYWDMASKNMHNFFHKLGQMKPVSLTLTKEVLEERRHLQTVLSSLQQQVQIGLNKLTHLNQERNLLSLLDDDMKGAKDHFIEVDIPKINKIDLEPLQCVTNCVKCSFTCHFPCHLPKTSDKQYCAAMKKGICKACPAKCDFTLHHHMDFRFETSWSKETCTAQQLLERYNKACLGKLSKEKVIHGIEEDIKDHAQGLIKLIKDIQRRVERLEEIALKPNPLSTREYIDLLIQSEKMQKLSNFEKRIEMLNKLKEEVLILEAATKAAGDLPDNGEALLTHFQNLIVQHG